MINLCKYKKQFLHIFCDNQPLSFANVSLIKKTSFWKYKESIQAFYFQGMNNNIHHIEYLRVSHVK